ncbi:MAG: aminotransferase class IV [Patescibacteria group bacterium]
MKNDLIHMINGKLVKETNLLIPVRDLGYLRGFAVFDFLVTYNNKAFMVDEHLDRLLNSASSINLSHPWSREQIKNMIAQTLQANSSDYDKTIKIILSGGKSRDGFTPENKPHLIIFLDKWEKTPVSLYQKGVKLITIKHKRNMPQSKTTDYLEAVKNSNLLKKEQAFEILYYDDLQVYEGSRSNIFALINGKLLTPENNILRGITRKIVLEELRLPVSVLEKNFNLEELLKAEEVFITKSNSEIVPVVKIGSHAVGCGKVGKITKLAMKKFREFIKAEGWLKL